MIIFNFVFYAISCLTFLLLYANRQKAVAKAGVMLYTLLTVIWLWATLSFREPTGGDPEAYMRGLERISHLNFNELLNYEGPLGFKTLNWIISYFSISSELFFSIIFFLCCGPLYLAFRENFNKFKSSTLLMLYLLYPFYFNHLSNTFKQGIASGFMLWGFSSIINKEDPKITKAAVLLLIATLFHSSFLIALVVCFIWYVLYRKIPLRWTLATLLIAIIISIINLTETIINIILPTQIVDMLNFKEYFDEDFISSEYYEGLNNKSGFRIDFTVFTVLPILYVLFLRRSHPEIVNEEEIIKIYCLLASVYFLLSFIPFSDRIASFSWFLIPFMTYSILDKLTIKNLKTMFVTIMLLSYGGLMLTYIKVNFQ